MKLATTTCDFDRFLNTYQERITAIVEQNLNKIEQGERDFRF